MRRRPALAAVLVALVLVAACGGDGGDGADESTIDDAVAAQGTSSAPQGASSTEQVFVFIDPTADLAAIEAIGDALVADERIVSVHLVDQQEAYDEFQCLFADNPALTGAMTVQSTPASYRIVVSDPDQVAEVVLDAQALPGVQEVAQGAAAVVPGTAPALELEVGSDCTAEGVTLK